jgi:hypothetical protein
MTATEIFLKTYPGARAAPPPGYGTQPQKFYEQNIAGWRGLPAGGLSISQAPLTFPLDVPFAGRGGAVVALSAADLSFGGRSGGASQVAGALGGRGRPGGGACHPVPIS